VQKHRILYIAIIIAVFSIIFFLGRSNHKGKELVETYEQKDKAEFGCYLTREFLNVISQDSNLITVNRAISNQLQIIPKEETNYIFMNSSFTPNVVEIELLDSFVKSGNNVFVAANYWEKSFLDTLQVETTNYFFQFSKDSLRSFFKLVDTIQCGLNDDVFQGMSHTVEMVGASNTAFSNIDDSSQVLGTCNNHINFVEVKRGAGSFYLHSTPKLFTNYAFVQDSMHNYIFSCLSYLPVADVWWDEYNKTYRPKNSSFMRYIYSQKYLKYAFNIATIGVLLLLFFGFRRTQNTIVFKPSKNNQILEYVSSLGNLFFFKGDNKLQIEGRLKNVRTFLLITYNIHFDENTQPRKISQNTGVSLEIAEKLCSYLQKDFPKTTGDRTLMSVNALLEKFYEACYK